MNYRIVTIAVVGLLAGGCVTSQWKITGGPEACIQMCENWGLEFSAMVGVGSQDSRSPQGATACVCQRALSPVTSSVDGAVGSSANLSAPISAEAAAQAAQIAAAQTAAANAAAAARVLDMVVRQGHEQPPYLRGE